MFLGMERGTQSTQGEGKIHFLGVENIFFGRQHMDPLKPCSELRRLAQQRIKTATDAGWCPKEKRKYEKMSRFGLGKGLQKISSTIENSTIHDEY